MSKAYCNGLEVMDSKKGVMGSTWPAKGSDLLACRNLA